MAKVELSEYEVLVVRFLASQFHESQYLGYNQFPAPKNPGEHRAAIDRLMRFGFIVGHTTGSCEILEKCLETVEAWDNPPLPDRWDEATKWFRSKRWSLPILVLAVGLPALKGWVDVIRLLLEWVGITHGSSK